MKVKCIVHEDLSEPQKYLCHGSFSNKLSSLLFNLRCKVVRGIKENFHRQYIILNNVILKLNSSVLPSSEGFISQYTP